MTSNEEMSCDINSYKKNELEKEEEDIGLNQTCQELGMDRLNMFKMLIDNAFERITSGVSEEQYIDLFGDLSVLKGSKSVPVKMQKQMKKNLVDSLKSEIENWIEDEKLEEKFQTLDNLSNDCAIFEGKETWRPNGNVNDHMRSHLMASKLSHKSALEEVVRQKEQSLEELKQKVSQLRNEVVSLESRLQHVTERSKDCTVLDSVDDMVTSCLNELNLK